MTNYDQFIASVQRERIWRERRRLEWRDADYRRKWWDGGRRVAIVEAELAAVYERKGKRNE